MHTRAITIVFAVCLTASSAAHANTEVAACVAKLTADSRLIFNSVRPVLELTADLRTPVHAKAIELVGAGKVSQAAAPDAALAAAAWLELSRK
jgi:hypothetical protein